MLDLELVRAQFPALARQDVFFDNPGGTQVAQPVIDRMLAYLTEHNANVHGAFVTSRQSDKVLDSARQAAADFVNAERAEEMVFGPNMTSLTLNLSRSLGETLSAGDHLVVTRLDHDANISPWMHIAEARGCQLNWVDFDVETGTLNLDDLDRALALKPKLVAVGYASNALGTINPVAQIVEKAQAAGALVFVDAVQYAPHGSMDVQALGCDFLVFSAYKIFGPHLGLLYGRHDHLVRLRAFKVRPAPADPPGKFETGTANHEGIAGWLGAVEYLEWIGETFGEVYRTKYSDRYQGRKLRLRQAMAAIRAYEFDVSRNMLAALKSVPGLRLYGLDDPRRVDVRVPTFAFTLDGFTPRQVAERLNEAGIYAWDGNYYALAVTERLGLENQGGMVRVGPVHYNTIAEIERLGETLRTLSSPHKYV